MTELKLKPQDLTYEEMTNLLWWFLVKDVPFENRLEITAEYIESSLGPEVIHSDIIEEIEDPELKALTEKYGLEFAMDFLYPNDDEGAMTTGDFNNMINGLG